MKFYKSITRDAAGYLFLTPWLIGLLAFTLIPIVASFYLALTDYDLFSQPTWVGLDNYKEMFTNDHRFYQSLKVTVTYVLIGVPLELMFALLLALALSKGIAGLRFYRAVYYIPSLFGGSVAIAILWREVFGADGIFNQLLSVFGITGVSWIASPEYAVYTLVLLKVWQFGSPMIIFLAGLQQIPKELYESAGIDGAGRLSSLLHITFPLLTPLIFFNLIMQIISAFQAFTPAYIISNGSGGPLDSTLFYTLLLYREGFANFNMGYASALAWVLLAIIAVFTALTFISSKKWVHYE
ncbi:carbohydrate ABC transporter permease [Paenibacillus piri]|uniref:Sugar ABC transporter permease n=1 Tax=Paenibacillus piri TaxID=2547395 RepID=A0A4V2ZU35_9BACL|nr:sugar ABC transporter permease [Paenibacillus piri]TDF99514.1 sugar ABC transporter permease [Paenibacillus piri]